MIVVMIRTRKAGSVTMLAYLSSSFLYTKGANLLLWFYADVRYGLFFTAIIIGTYVVLYFFSIGKFLSESCVESWKTNTTILYNI